jgi:tripartite-type tricarboxylate transporter receptor subunit TctC
MRPARTPPEIVARLAKEVGEIVRQVDVAETLNKQGLTIAYRGPEELGRYMRQESTRWAAVVKEKNLVGE